MYFKANITCGEDDILWDEFMIHDGKLGQLNPVHPCHSTDSSSPIEFNVVRGITVWKKEQVSVGTAEACAHNYVPSASCVSLQINHLAYLG